MAAPAVAPIPAAPAAGPTPSVSASLYVGDLARDVREEQLFEIFSVVGPIDSIRVLRDHITRFSLGYAYVNFTSSQDAERALDSLNYYCIKGRPIRIMWKQRDPSLRKSGVGNIFIKNLDKSVDSRTLLDTFSQFGNILSCKVATDDNGVSKGFGFVQYQTREEAEKAIKMNGNLLAGKQLSVAHFLHSENRHPDKKRFVNVFVKNFEESVTDQQLSDTFAQFGKITSAVIARDASGKSKRHGFVCFEDPDAAANMVEKAHDSNLLGGEKIAVFPHVKKAIREQRNRRDFEQRKLQRFQGVNLYVKYLDDDINDDKLRAEFSPFGTITSAKVVVDDKGVSRGFGFVCFSSPEEATKAVTEMNGKMVGTKPLFVALHQNRQQRAQVISQTQMQRAAYNPGMRPNMYGMGMAMGNPYMTMYGGVPAPFPAQFGRMMRPAMAPGMRQPQSGGVRAPGAYNARPQRAPNAAGVPVAAPGAVRPQSQQPQTGVVYAQKARNVPVAAPAQNMAPPAAQKNDLASMLASATPEMQKQMLGERLYMLIVPTQHSLAGKITGMLLEGLDTPELLGLIDSPVALNEKIQLALEALQKHSASK